MRHTPGKIEFVSRDDARGQPVVYYRGLIATIEHGPGGHLSIVTEDGRTVEPEEWSTNGERIAAAWNFVEGIPTQALEGGSLVGLVEGLDAVVHLREMHRHFGSDRVTVKTLIEFCDEKLLPILDRFQTGEDKTP